MVEVLTPRFTKRLEHLGVVDFEGLLIRPQLFKENSEILEKVQNSLPKLWWMNFKIPIVFRWI